MLLIQHKKTRNKKIEHKNIQRKKYNTEKDNTEKYNTERAITEEIDWATMVLIPKGGGGVLGYWYCGGLVEGVRSSGELSLEN